MGKINSKQKGGRGEREFASFLKEEFGIEARRGIQFQGSPDSPDVVTDLKHIHFEVKRTETFSPYKALEQARADSGDKIPVVAHRRNRKEWILVIHARDLKNFSRAVNDDIPS